MIMNNYWVVCINAVVGPWDRRQAEAEVTRFNEMNRDCTGGHHIVVSPVRPQRSAGLPVVDRHEL